MGPLDIINKHLRAYAAVDLDHVMADMTEECVLAGLNGETIAEGRKQVRSAFSRAMTAYPRSLTKNVNRIMYGPCVVDYDILRRLDGIERRAINVYTLRGRQIHRLDLYATTQKGDFSDLAQAQMDAYNVHSLELYMTCFHDDCVIADFNGQIVSSGAEAIAQRYATMFSRFPETKLSMLNRIAVGGIVIDHQLIERAPGKENTQMLAIYTVVGHKIGRVDLVR